MGVAGRAPTAMTGRLVVELEAKSKEQGHHEFNERFAIAQQLHVGGFILEIDRNSAVCSCPLWRCRPCVPLWHRVINVLRHDVGNMLEFQEHCDGIRALPRNPLECDLS